ncbi:hypothetical protein CARUB_v10018329mg [Capsella rubella]|uniref:Secreted protein n=1 Tax=Capsella rubella TaxID=81985 RepID=R0HHL5_9BRAS|nr:hypothetical protein CARUB_v10018329mg [Capsella rubella]
MFLSSTCFLFSLLFSPPFDHFPPPCFMTVRRADTCPNATGVYHHIYEMVCVIPRTDRRVTLVSLVSDFCKIEHRKRSTYYIWRP